MSPFGTGFDLRPSKICEGAVKMQSEARKFAGPSMAFGSAQKRWAMEPLGTVGRSKKLTSDLRVDK